MIEIDQALLGQALIEPFGHVLSELVAHRAPRAVIGQAQDDDLGGTPFA
jgi:hypothetical protein